MPLLGGKRQDGQDRPGRDRLVRHPGTRNIQCMSVVRMMNTVDAVARLAQAAYDGDTPLVARLLGEGVAVDGLNSGGRTALDLAVQRGHDEVVRLLVGAGADLEQRAGEYGESTPLCLAALEGHTAVVGVLLDAGVHPESRNGFGHAPLVLAATAGAEGHPDTVDLLVDRGADIDVLMKDRTPLDWAAGFGQVRMVHQLLGRGATPTAQALALAREHAERYPESRQKFERVIDVLRAAGATPGTDQAARQSFRREEGN
ncbi:ankyrin repeat domain-containing protein [Streptomyces celluloflavus]|uniref:ankyrin repeat domain-containing protein n=1 Tax=Streptomyces celluloflavus TaxID=58344 RepID=UPI0036A23E4E